MPKYKLLINAKDFDEVRVAIINEEGVLEQVDFESLVESTHYLSNIYKATVTAVEASLQATFVDYGGHRHGFLPFNEIHPNYYASNDPRVPLERKIHVGQQLLVQVAREEIGLKGAYLTTYVSLAGRYLVMMPFSKKVGISRKIEDPAERHALRKVVEQVTVPGNMGYIIRTAGLGTDREQIQRDINVLVSTWSEVKTRAEKVQAPSLLYREDNVVNRTIRDYFNEDVTEILIDEQHAFDEIKSYFKKMIPSHAHIVKMYRGKAPIFSKYQLEDQVERIFSRRVRLPSGGSIVIEQTEALVVIDVNSGKTSEANLELTALRTDLEAAEEIARQLRLRDLGGLIVVDFIDLKDRRNIAEVERRFRESLKVDKARVTMTGMSRFGLLEMSRQRIKTSKEIKHYDDCPVCKGLGRVKTIETQAIDLLRRIKLMVANATVLRLIVTCSEDVGLHVLNHRRGELREMEQKFNVEISIQLTLGHHVSPRFEIVKRALEDKTDMPMPTPLSLAAMAASMSEEDLNEHRDYRAERIEALEATSFDALRTMEIPVPEGLHPFDQFNFSMRLLLMKRHGLFQQREQEFKDALRLKILGNKDKGVNARAVAELLSPDSQSRIALDEDAEYIDDDPRDMDDDASPDSGDDDLFGSPSEDLLFDDENDDEMEGDSGSRK